MFNSNLNLESGVAVFGSLLQFVAVCGSLCQLMNIRT